MTTASTMSPATQPKAAATASRAAQAKSFALFIEHLLEDRVPRSIRRQHPEGEELAALAVGDDPFRPRPSR
jgi:hypothetical protein